ncbi:MAG TPA: 5'-3' exonuclease H3TH domain-containing protein [Candidatus Paceibacterota bacterium]|nr:5'-3' exonuclease H3TH domain-containing protein [Candidatus Paceibacterota bacterium]
MKKLVLIDSNALVHRAFHALPPLTTRKGELTNAVYGFFSALIKVINELKPDYMVATFDLAAPTFRHIEYDQYKAKRPKAPDELYAQIPRTKEVLKAFGIPILEKKGFEADDIIGTIAKKYTNKEIDILIVTGDLDTLQLIDDNIRIYTMKKGLSDIMIYGEKEVEERYGLKVSQMIDYKALRGDPSDNIPGVKGIGEKGASNLLKEFGTLENLYKKLDKLTERQIIDSPALSKSVVEKLRTNKKMAFFSKSLATIRLNVPVKIDLKELDWQNHFNMDKVRELFIELGFNTLLRRLPGGEAEKKAEIQFKQANLF